MANPRIVAAQAVKDAVDAEFADLVGRHPNIGSFQCVAQIENLAVAILTMKLIDERVDDLIQAIEDAFPPPNP